MEEGQPKRESYEKDKGTPRQVKPHKNYRFCQDLAVLGFGPDTYDDGRLEEKDIQYFKRLSMYIAGDRNKAQEYISGKQ